jgi:predicted dehydrogenase
MTPTGFPATLPAPRRPDPLDVPALRWGVLGTGWIAERFVHALRTSTTQQVVAVGSRTQASAERFAGAAGGLTAHGSAEEVSAAAATAGVLCMEAMWTLFLPRFDVVRRVLEQGVLGDVRTLLADHGERFDPPHRILDPALAGGSLLDLGCYLTAGCWARPRTCMPPVR